MRLRLKEAMKASNASAQELADKCGIANVQTVYNMMSGATTRIAPETVECLCRVLHTDANFLYGIKINQRPVELRAEFADIIQDGEVIGRNRRVVYRGDTFWQFIGESDSAFEKRVAETILRKRKQVVIIKTH
jgi:DNA-binding Xre family transcriptional regulator